MTFKVPEKYRITGGAGVYNSDKRYGCNGAFRLPYKLIGDKRAGVKKPMQVIVSDQDGWEHLSASYPNRAPSWPEMCRLKNLFWDDDDVVMQYHPRKSDYIDNHPFCLHLWRPTDAELPTPPALFVGIEGVKLLQDKRKSENQSTQRDN